MNVTYTTSTHALYFIYDDDEADIISMIMILPKEMMKTISIWSRLVCVFCLMMTKFILIIMMIILK